MSSSLYFHRIFLTAINQLLLFRVLTVNCLHAICFSTDKSSCHLGGSETTRVCTNAYKSSSDRRSGSTCWVSSNSVFLGFSGSSPVGFIASL